MRKIFRWFYLCATLAIFLVMWGLKNVAVSLDFLNVFEEVISDYNVTDLAFKLRNAPPADTSIVLVNIGNLDRTGIAQQLNVLNHFGPRTVGIDVEFSQAKDPESDSIVEAAFANTKNLVLWSKVAIMSEKNSTQWDTLLTVLPRFKQHARTGYTNAITEGNSAFEAWRETTSKETLPNGHTEYSFAAQISLLYDSAKAQKFLKRGHLYENINFRGNTEKFIALDVMDVLDTAFVPSLIKDKIVVLCYMGSEYNSSTWDGDKYYSPLNEQQIGRTPPDMYGGVIHANIVSMILHEDYIDELPEWVGYLVAVLACYFNVVLFGFINNHPRLGLWYNIITKLIQLTETVLLVYVIINLFANYHLKADLTVAIFAILLSGDIFEIFATLFGNIFGKHNRQERTV